MSETTARKATYLMLWRWHFFAGLFCIPLVITLSISGALYLFNSEYNDWQMSRWQSLPEVSPRSNANQQIIAAMDALPGSRFLSYELPTQQNSGVQINLMKDGERHQLVINPYTLELLDDRIYEHTLMRQIRSFHGELLTGEAGSLVVELAACWAIVLIISGLYLGWPSAKHGINGLLKIRIRAGRRLFWRDLHVMTGVWVSLFALFLLITGLPWASVWGSAFKQVRQWHAELNAPPTQDWSTSRKQDTQSWQQKAVSHINLNDDVLRAAYGLQYQAPVLLSVSDDQHGVWQVASMTQNRPLRSTGWLASDGLVLRQQHFEDMPAVDRWIGIGIAAHEGHLFGIANQVLGVLVCLALVLLSASGAVLWWRRKPAGAIGAPPIISEQKNSWPVWGIAALCCLLMPLLGVSVVVIWLADTLVTQIGQRILATRPDSA